MQKMLGTMQGARVVDAPFVVTAHANRVPVLNGHTVCLSLGFETKPSVEEAIAVIRAWKGDPSVRGLPSAPETPIRYRDEPDRPQPRRDVMEANGMGTVVGRVRADNILHLRLVAMSHNTIRGAAGGSILNAELLVNTGMIPRSAGA